MSTAKRIFADSDSARTADPSAIREGFYENRDFKNCSPRTIETYRQRLNWLCDYLESRCPGITIDKVEQKHIIGYILSLKRRNLKPATVKSQYIALRAFYRWMVGQGFIEEKAYPLQGLTPPLVPKVIKGFLSVEQFKKLLGLCPPNRFLGARNAAIIWLFWTSSMRLSELTNLQLSDMDWRAERIKVMGKGARERYVPFSKQAKQAVWRYLQYREDDLPWLWVSEERDKRLLQRGIQEVMYSLYRDTGIKVKDACHVFRRSWATEAIRANVNLNDVRLVGGWKSLVTLQGYIEGIQAEQALEGYKKVKG